MKRAVLAAAALLLAASAFSQPYGMGPGMMGGYGGYGMGPGMMGGYGMGQGMMGGYGMGPNAMRGGGNGIWSLDLSADQRKKIAAIEEETGKAQWQLMGTMHQQDFHMNGMFGSGAVDEADARKAYQAMSDAHKAMFELSLDARKRIEAVLTKEQREKLRHP